MVIWSYPARDDLRAIHDFIALDSPHYAKKTVQDIREKMEGVDQLPRRGIVVSELNDENVRELSRYSYRIIYEVKQELVVVLTVVHKRRDLKAEDIIR